MTRMPSDDDLNTAIAWLLMNDGDNGESTRCSAVADWLADEKFERWLRSAAREAGMTVATARRKLAERNCYTGRTGKTRKAQR